MFELLYFSVTNPNSTFIREYRTTWFGGKKLVTWKGSGRHWTNIGTRYICCNDKKIEQMYRIWKLSYDAWRKTEEEKYEGFLGSRKSSWKSFKDERPPENRVFLAKDVHAYAVCCIENDKIHVLIPRNGVMEEIWVDFSPTHWKEL